MSDVATSSVRPSKSGPIWNIALLFPEQEQFNEADYLQLTDMTSKLVEFVNGDIEVPPMPDILHQRLSAFIYQLLAAFCASKGVGEVFFAPIPVKLGDRHFREPDIVFVLKQNRQRFKKSYIDGADLVIEMISTSRPHRDLVEKCQEYAAAGIREYWIVDPRDDSATVLALDKNTYREAGVFRRGHVAFSQLLAGFEVSIEQLFEYARALD